MVLSSSFLFIQLSINTHDIIQWLSHSFAAPCYHLCPFVFSDGPIRIRFHRSRIACLVLTNLVELLIVLRMFVKSAREVSRVLIDRPLLVVFDHSAHVVLFHYVPLFLRLHYHAIRRRFRIYTVSACHFHHVVYFLLVEVVQVPSVILGVVNRSEFMLSYY